MRLNQKKNLPQTLFNLENEPKRQRARKKGREKRVKTFERIISFFFFLFWATIGRSIHEIRTRACTERPDELTIWFRYNVRYKR